MGDKPWKKHERNTAEYFGTQRALHGLDRDVGEVQTDVFVDVYDWFVAQRQPIPDLERDFPTALVVECKYCGSGSSTTNDWPCIVMGELEKSKGVKKCGVIPVFVTRDKWTWVRMKDFLSFYGHKYLDHDTPLTGYEVTHLNRKVSTFFYDAIAQAEQANLPVRRGGREPFERRVHVVCVGSNARLPKMIGIPFDSEILVNGST